jgi:hypothetical protein
LAFVSPLDVLWEMSIYHSTFYGNKNRGKEKSGGKKNRSGREIRAGGEILGGDY